jgi:hypothetical protein
MEKGVEQVNAQRATQGQQPVGEQLDHFHVQQEARRALRRFRQQANRLPKACAASYGTPGVPAAWWRG